MRENNHQNDDHVMNLNETCQVVILIRRSLSLGFSRVHGIHQLPCTLAMISYLITRYVKYVRGYTTSLLNCEFHSTELHSGECLLHIRYDTRDVSTSFLRRCRLLATIIASRSEILFATQYFHKWV